MKLAAPEVKYMYTLPASHGKKVTDEVINDSMAIVYDETENRLYTAKAVMVLTMSGRP